MEQQREQWIILSDIEYGAVWDKVYDEFCFYPGIDLSIPAFTFRVPFNVYNFVNVPGGGDVADKTLTDIFIKCKCMGSDEYMYALDWQHCGFRYNPKIAEPKKDTFITDDRYPGGGYDAYFPSFYPDGDYYFFISKNFSWGYLTHPWHKKAWVFGSRFMNEVEKNSDGLCLTRCIVK